MEVPNASLRTGDSTIPPFEPGVGPQPRRATELSRDEIVARYPEVSPFVILKMDVQRRGVRYTERALDTVDPLVHLTRVRTIFGPDPDGGRPVPVSFSLRDGTSVLISPNDLMPDPYVVDLNDGHPMLVDLDDYRRCGNHGDTDLARI